MRIIQDDIWLCTDCFLAAVNGDFSSIDYFYPEAERAARLSEIEKGLENLGPHLVPDYDVEAGKGHEEFSKSRCDCCGTRLAGERHRFAVLGEDQTVPFSPLSPGHHVRDGHFGTRENPMVHQAVKTVFSCGPFRVHEEDRVPGRPRCWRIVEAYTGLALGSAFRLKKNAISCARSVGSRPEYLKRANRGDAHAKRVLLRLRAMYSLRD